jgi:hypothetical protein
MPQTIGLALAEYQINFDKLYNEPIQRVPCWRFDEYCEIVLCVSRYVSRKLCFGSPAAPVFAHYRCPIIYALFDSLSLQPVGHGLREDFYAPIFGPSVGTWLVGAVNR